MNRTLAALAALLAAAPFAAAAEPLPPDHAAKMARGLELFKAHVRPLLAKQCLKCHGGEVTESEFDLTDRPALLKGGLAGPAVVPGKGKESLLVRLINHTKKPYMPEGRPKLADADIARVTEWVDLGAPYDKPLVDKPEDRTAWTRRTVPDDARKFWSYQPLARPDLPAVKDAAWCRTPADRFVLAKIEAAGLAPSRPADKRTLVRRVTFDVTGLPPTPEEVDAFVADESPDAYEKLIDRLLASPGYGEKWGRHWLDLARFAESHGFEHDYDRPTAYHYRDFVIKALNADLPFDKFAKWQLAGDEFEPQNPLALAATGFLAAGVHSTQITKNEVEKHRYDELDDMLATTTTSFLGLTVGCARCHDHKFDAFPQADYYRMLSAFTTTVRSEVEVDYDPSVYAKAKADFDREHAPFADALRKYDAEQLPSKLAGWLAKGESPSPWTVLTMSATKSAGGATFTPQGDGSLLVGGTNPKRETWTFTATTDLAGVTAFRLDALADPSLVKGGPGRADNGNFALTDFKVTAAPKSDPAKAVPVKLKAARADFEQKGLPVAAAIDADPMSGWAVDPQFGTSHAAVFECEMPLAVGETVLTFTLQFQNNDKHAIGRPRLSVSAGPAPLDGEPLPPAVRDALAAKEKRTPAQEAALLAWFAPRDPERVPLAKAEREHAAKAPKPAGVKALISTEGRPAVRLHTQGEDFLPATHFLKRGDVAQKDGEAAVGFLQVLTPADGGGDRWKPAPPPGATTSHRRRALAEWLTDTEKGAGALLARVAVNRLWHRHLGRGIVATPSDFGTRGERPSHPELLDWLAGELIRNDWRLKPLHKTILMSATYRQACEVDAAKAKADPENRLFARRLPRRLEAESIRDAMLAVSGVLEPRMFGPGTLDEGSKRRSVYFTVKRSQLVPMLQVFDATDASGSVGERPTTTIAPQALYLLNNPQVRGYARALAKRAEGDAPVRAAYRLALGRLPTADEEADALDFLARQEGAYKAAGKSDARHLALADFCQTLFCLNEFAYTG